MGILTLWCWCFKRESKWKIWSQVDFKKSELPTSRMLFFPFPYQQSTVSRWIDTPIQRTHSEKFTWGKLLNFCDSVICNPKKFLWELSFASERRAAAICPILTTLVVMPCCHLEIQVHFNFRVKSAGCEKNGYFERYSLYVLVYYIHTFILILIHWFIEWSCHSGAPNMLLLFQDKDTHSESCHRDPYYAAFNLQKKNLQIVCQKTSIFFVPGAFPFPNCSSTILQYSSPVSGKSPLGSCMICIRFFHP